MLTTNGTATVAQQFYVKITSWNLYWFAPWRSTIFIWTSNWPRGSYICWNNFSLNGALLDIKCPRPRHLRSAFSKILVTIGWIFFVIFSYSQVYAFHSALSLHIRRPFLLDTCYTCLFPNVPFYAALSPSHYITKSLALSFLILCTHIYIQLAHTHTHTRTYAHIHTHTHKHTHNTNSPMYTSNFDTFT
jgi:hypothetical protein